MLQIHGRFGGKVVEGKAGTLAKAKAFISAHLSGDITDFAWIQYGAKDYTADHKGAVTADLMGRDAWLKLQREVNPMEEIVVEQCSATTGELIRRSRAELHELEFDYTDLQGRATHRKALVMPPWQDITYTDDTGKQHKCVRLVVWMELRPEDVHGKLTWGLRHIYVKAMSNIVDNGQIAPEHPMFKLLERTVPCNKITAQIRAARAQ